jgi:hypothetical protein
MQRPIARLTAAPPRESSRAQKYGPPAVAATPRTEAEWATPICTAMKAPDEMPDTVVWPRSSLSSGSAPGAAWADAASSTPSAKPARRAADKSEKAMTALLRVDDRTSG